MRLNLADAAAVRQAYDDIVAAARRVAPKAAVEGVLIQPMVAGGVETMMGIVQDPLFGPLIAFGLGGIHVEILRDVRFRLAPLTDRDVDELLHGIKGFRCSRDIAGIRPPISTRCASCCCASRGWPTRCRRSRSSISIR